MLTAKWPLGSVWSELDRLHSEIRRRSASGPGSGPGSGGDSGAFPAMNVWSSDDRYFVEAELPGWSIEEIEIVVQGNEITIEGKQPAEVDSERTYHRRERRLQDFKRTFSLTDDVDSESVTAELRSGVLHLELPKQESLKPRRIRVTHRN